MVAKYCDAFDGLCPEEVRAARELIRLIDIGFHEDFYRPHICATQVEFSISINPDEELGLYCTQAVLVCVELSYRLAGLDVLMLELDVGKNGQSSPMVLHVCFDVNRVFCSSVVKISDHAHKAKSEFLCPLCGAPAIGRTRTDQDSNGPGSMVYFFMQCSDDQCGIRSREVISFQENRATLRKEWSREEKENRNGDES